MAATVVGAVDLPIDLVTAMGTTDIVQVSQSDTHRIGRITVAENTMAAISITITNTTITGITITDIGTAGK